MNIVEQKIDSRERQSPPREPSRRRRAGWLALWARSPFGLFSDADLLNSVDTDEHKQRLTQTRGVIEAHRRHAARLREGLSVKPRLVR